VAERYAEGLATRRELRAAMLAYNWEEFYIGPPAALKCAYDAAYLRKNNLPNVALLPLVREVFGNPFRPVIAEPSWLTPNVIPSRQHAAVDQRGDDGLRFQVRLLEHGAVLGGAVGAAFGERGGVKRERRRAGEVIVQDDVVDDQAPDGLGR